MGVGTWLLNRIGIHPLKRTPLQLYNTLTKSLQIFTLPSHAREVRMYNCGPTVYGRQHVGNLSMFVFTDVLRRTFEYNGYLVRQVINFTDFGHLTSDADEGDDKMVTGLKREGLKPTLENMRALGEKYADLFLEDLRLLNVEVDRVTFPRASDYIAPQIAMIRTLEEKGYTYTTASGVYFDTARFPAYGKLGDINLEGLKEGARVKASADKRNPTDFLLWKTSKKLGWDSPWGKGFPGWHIECSAMINATLGKQIDIHTGGIEHIPVHHNNEIAQSECATGKHPLARFWLHREHLQFEGGKLAKSTGNVVYLSDVVERGFHPLALRYLLLGAHYRTPANFTWDALTAAQNAFIKLVALRLSITDTVGTVSNTWRKQFVQCINNDLDTVGALAVVWEMVKDNSLTSANFLATLEDFDRVLGLNLAEPDVRARELASLLTKETLSSDSLPQEVKEMSDEREAARTAKEWALADQLRDQMAAAGFGVEDTPEGPRIYKL